jgi:hypothetical protein
MDTAPIQGTPEVVLRCADCGEVKPIVGTRFVHPDLPYDVLCQPCWDFTWRYLSREHLHLLGPASETDEDGTLWLRRVCPRCGGEGKVEPYPGACFRCWGWRWSYVSPRNVNMVMKASATFQANRIPRSQEHPR